MIGQPRTGRLAGYAVPLCTESRPAALLAATVAGAGYLWRMEKMEKNCGRRACTFARTAIRCGFVEAERANDRSGSESAVAAVPRRESEGAGRITKIPRNFRNQEPGIARARARPAKQKLAGAIATAEQLRQQLATTDGDKQRLAKLQQDSDAKLHEALVELYQARQANAQVATETEAHDATKIDANSQPASASEIEARNLFGARDLHIVDVYDVAGDGKTKRTYGRVYYVEKKLLVFYAFDLQKRQDFSKKLAVFQAWGYREANVGKPLNLGLFTVDDGGAGRWVLTVNRPDVLSHIDAVFVTVEPPGGSTLRAVRRSSTQTSSGRRTIRKEGHRS